MAIQRTTEGSRLQLQFQTGVTGDGKPIVKSRSFSNLKVDAVDENVHAAAEIVAGLQEHTLLVIRRIDTSALDEI